MDGQEWEGWLGPAGPKFAFVRFARPGEVIDSSAASAKAALRQRLGELLAAPLPLPPQPNAEIITTTRQKTITDDQITDFEFECPSCRNPYSLLCPVCKKFSCRGATRDSGGRIQCQWCFATLVFSSSSGEGERLPIEIDATM